MAPQSAAANLLARQLTPQEPRANSYNPFSNSQVSQNGNVGSQLQNSVDQNQAQFGADYTNQRNDLLNQIQSASIGNTSQGTDQLAPNSSFFNQLASNSNSAVQQIAQVGQIATDSINQSTNQAWQSRMSKLNSDYQANSASASNFQFSPDQVNQIVGSYSAPGFDVNSLGNLQAFATPAGSDPNSPGARAVALARQVVANGTPYVWGGNSLTQGVDCSGLVQQVYGRLGIQLPRTSTEQAKFGKIVPSLSQAMPGDLILEYSPYESAGLQQYGHVGIYIGNGMLIEAPGTGQKVRIGPIYNMTKIVRPW